MRRRQAPGAQARGIRAKTRTRQRSDWASAFLNREIDKIGTLIRLAGIKAE